VSKIDELRGRVNDADVFELRQIVRSILDILEDVTKKAAKSNAGASKPKNNPAPIKAPKIDDSVKTTVIGHKEGE
jgi:hypothetical protein